MISILCSEAVRRWNAQIELTDYALGLAAVDVHDPRKLLSLLSISGHHELRATLQAAGAELGYWAPDGGPAQPRPERPDPGAGLPADSRPTISADRTKSLKEETIQAWDSIRIAQDKIEGALTDLESSMQILRNRELCLRDAIKRDENWREFCKNSARPGDVANVILERDNYRALLKECRAALELALTGTPSPHYFAQTKKLLGLSASNNTIEDGLARNMEQIKTESWRVLEKIKAVIPVLEK